MISVLNHLQRLSGNNCIFFLLFFLLSCSVPKKSVENSDVQVVKSAKNLPANIKSDSIKPPKNGTNPLDLNPVKVDTVVWTDVSPSFPPISVKEKKNVIQSKGIDLREEYNIKILIPLNSDGNIDPSSSRFVHFYAGLLKALEELDDENIKLNISVIDTEEGMFKVSEKIDEILSPDVDMIIGPFERDDLKILAEECKNRAIPLVSPWQTSTKLTLENPYYIQMKPNLKEHFLKLAESSVETFNPGEVVIIGKNNKETNSWIKYFQEAASNGSQKNDFFATYFVSTDSLNLGPTAFMRMFKNTKLKAVIIPNYSYTDEDFIYSCLRRLTAEKGNRQISVMGMPILFDSDKIDFDFYNTLQMKVVMSDFVDENHGKIREFRRDYLDLYGEIPNSDASKGYDLMLYLGRNIWKYGKNFQNYLENEATSYLQSTYDIRKSKAEDSNIINDSEKFDYYENKHLDIIEFKGNKWLRKRQ